MSTPLLELQHVDVTFEGALILRDISLTLERGQILTIVGPNGSGKTTLLKVCLGLLPPSGGSVAIVPCLKIGYMPQRLVIEKSLPLDVETFLGLSASLDEVNRVLAEVGAACLSKRSIHVLSGGEMQRVLLAKALLGTPDLLVLDEPLQGVDVAGQADLYTLIQRIRDQRHCGILLVSHDLYFVHRASDWVMCLNTHVCCSGKPEEVQSNPAYHALFGGEVARILAPYTHHHDHTHEHTVASDGTCHHESHGE